MKFAIATVAYKEERMIQHFLKHYSPLVDEIVVLNSDRPWNGTKVYNTDETPLHCKDYDNVTCYMMDWHTEHEQRNWGINMLSHAEYDWVFILDPDEYFNKETFLRLKAYLAEDKDTPAFKAPMDTYWKKNYIIVPRDTHKPVVAVRPGKVRFTQYRGIDTPPFDLSNDFILHHFSWARTDEEVKNKLSHFSHSNEFNWQEWYDRVWKGWHPAMNHLHPLTKEKWFQAIPCEVPKEFRAITEEL